MLMVIIGAGASYDSASDYLPPKYHHDDRPPLANELFDNRVAFRQVLARFADCQSLVTRLHQPDPSVEELLDLAQVEAADHPIRYRQLAEIRFYLRTIIWELEDRWHEKHLGVTNHKTLLDDVERWRLQSKEDICLVTFNYDRMIESALPVVGIAITKLDDYIRDPRYKLIKVHGSVDWAHPAGFCESDQGQRTVYKLINGAQSLKIDDEIERITQPSVASRPVGPSLDIALFPALAIPVTQKADFECPRTHLNALRQAIPQVTRIITVGWRATEKHFLKLLRENLRAPLKGVMVVAGDRASADVVATNLRAAGVSALFTRSASGFSEAVRNREIDHFLWQQ